MHPGEPPPNQPACAAAIANLKLFESERTLGHVAELCGKIDELLEPLRAHPLVREVRRAGLMIGIELTDDSGWPVADYLYERGHFTRPIGNVVVLMPPYCTTAEQVNKMSVALRESIVEILGK